MVLYDDANQGIIPGTERYFSAVIEPTIDWWTDYVLSIALDGRRRSAAFRREMGICQSEDRVSKRSSQLELLFDDHPYHD